MIGRAVVCVVLGAGLGLVAATPRRAAAEPAGDAVALLPLDADRSLEIYGQPVAAEIARALGAGNIRVVVVGPRTAMPDSVRMIIDGTISVGKGSAVTISVRLRQRSTGVLLRKDPVTAGAPSLARIDAAAADLSSRLLPIVRELLATLPAESEDHGRIVALPPAPAPARPVLVAVDAGGEADRGALTTAAADWIRGHHRALRGTDPARLTTAALAGAGAELALRFSILAWTVEPASDPRQPAMARARVRVQILSPRAIVFDRVVVTDTVLGDPGHDPSELAARVAREVLAILEPHVRRSVPSWR